MLVSVVLPNYNSATVARRAVRAQLGQVLAQGDTLEVVVADDGSTDGSAQALQDAFAADPRVRVLALPVNRGRSAARNAGAQAARGELLVFVDSDCVAADSGFLAAHLAAFRAGARASFGPVLTPGEGFWDRLQRQSAARNLAQFTRGERWSFTTQNAAVARADFLRVGGFDEEFDRYGFEDRDLFLRLDAAGVRSEYAEDAGVLHEDRLQLANVARKMHEAALHSSQRFREKHPAAYRSQAFGKLDGVLRPWLRVVDALAWPLARSILAWPEGWLEARWLPFALRAFAARSLYALSYLHGTLRRRMPERG